MPRPISVRWTRSDRYGNFAGGADGASGLVTVGRGRLVRQPSSASAASAWQPLPVSTNRCQTKWPKRSRWSVR